MVGVVEFRGAFVALDSDLGGFVVPDCTCCVSVCSMKAWPNLLAVCCLGLKA